MALPVFIFIGRSGCGKGTQAEMLDAYIKKFDSGAEILYLQTGAEFREFIKQEGLIPELARGVNKLGERQPDFLVVHLWAKFLLKNYHDGTYLILDGTPRSENESRILDTVFPFLRRKNVFVLFLDVSKENAAKRLLARGRSDDNPEEIEKRLGWYETDVAPALEYLSTNPWYTFLHIDGEPIPEKIHEEIIVSLEKHNAFTQERN